MTAQSADRDPRAPIRRLGVDARMSQAVVHGDTVYLSGITAPDVSQPVEHQTRQVLDRIDALLAQVGSDKSRVLHATIWLTDTKSFEAFNGVWDAWVAPGAPPARATVGSDLARVGKLVEIGVIAAL